MNTRRVQLWRRVRKLPNFDVEFKGTRKVILLSRNVATWRLVSIACMQSAIVSNRRVHDDGTPVIRGSTAATSSSGPTATPAPSASPTSAASRSASRCGARARRSRSAWSTATPTRRIDDAWWRRAPRARHRAPRRAATRTRTRTASCTAKATRLPSLVVDRYDRWLVVQLMSAGLERFRADDRRVRSTSSSQPDGILARNDVSLRAKEGLATDVELLARRRAGRNRSARARRSLPRRAVARPEDGRVSRPARESRARRSRRARPRARLLQLSRLVRAAPRARAPSTSSPLDASAARARRAPRRTSRATDSRTSTFVEANAFDYLRGAERERARFDTIVLDPPAFAKTRPALPAALRGYKEINLRAMRLLAPGGLLFTASCSFHLTQAALPRDARSSRGGQRSPHGAARAARTAARSSGSADDSGDRIPQGSAARGAGLTVPRDAASTAWHVGQKYVLRPACTMRSIGVRQRRHGFPSRS